MKKILSEQEGEQRCNSAPPMGTTIERNAAAPLEPRVYWMFQPGGVGRGGEVEQWVMDYRSPVAAGFVTLR